MAGEGKFRPRSGTEEESAAVSEAPSLAVKPNIFLLKSACSKIGHGFTDSYALPKQMLPYSMETLVTAHRAGHFRAIVPLEPRMLSPLRACDVMMISNLRPFLLRVPFILQGI